MEKSEVLAELDRAMDLAPGTLSGGEELSELATWDSMAVMNFIAFASDKCSIVLSPREIVSCQTVADLLNLVNGSRQK